MNSDKDYFSHCYASSEPQGFAGTHAVAGWTLFFSLVVFLYQIFALLQIFIYLKVLYMKIRLGKYLWYLFPLIVSDLYLHAYLEILYDNNFLYRTLVSTL